MPNMFDVTISKINELVQFDYDSLPEASRRYVAQYGFNKSINDTHASIKRTDYPEGDAGTAEHAGAVRDAAMHRVDQIRTGNVPGTRGPADPDRARVATVVRNSKANTDAAAVVGALAGENPKLLEAIMKLAAKMSKAA